MYFDSKKEEDTKRALTYLQHLIGKQKRFEIVERRPKRTLPQNNYLHLILSWYCIETGNTLDFVKEQYFKRLCNPEIFVVEKQDKYLGLITLVRSSSEIDTKEMAIAIERFRNWSSMEGGIYLPGANEDKYLEHIQSELNRQKQWI